MTRFNNKYPYTDFHELNADWLLETVKDAEAEAKEAADTVATYNDRLTTVEGDLAPIKAAMPGLASDVSDLQHDVGIMDSLITNTINPGLDTLQNEVEAASTGLLDRMTAAEGSITTLQNEIETPSTGLLARVTALENAPAVGGVTKYLKFSSGNTPFDYDARITYSYLVGLIGTTASVDMPVNIILVEDDELGTTWYYTLNEGEYQVSAGTPRGAFTFTCRKPVLDENNVVTGYKVCTVDVDKNSATPTYTEVYEAILPAVTSADAGDMLTVDGNGDWIAATPGGITQEITDALQVNATYVPQANINVKVAKTGNIVTVTGSFRNEYNGLTGSVLDIIYKPITALHALRVGWDTTGNDMTAYLDTNGILKTYSTAYDSGNYYLSFSYITND